MTPIKQPSLGQPPGIGCPGRLCAAIRKAPPGRDHTGPGKGFGAVQAENSGVLGTWARLCVNSIMRESEEGQGGGGGGGGVVPRAQGSDRGPAFLDLRMKSTMSLTQPSVEQETQITCAHMHTH